MKKIFFFFQILTIALYAQKIDVTGRVVEQGNVPLEGVNVILMGTEQGAATNAKGKFVISSVHYGTYQIQFSAIGYKTLKLNDFVVNENTKELKIVLEEDVISTEQVVVTAGKREQRIEDLPVSSLIMLPKMINRQNFNSLDQALRYAPGVTMALNQISIRGSSGYSMGAGTRVLVAMDGVPIYSGDTGEIVWELIPLTDIERIEIIKGPASSLYGSTAIGGVVNIISKKPAGKAVNHISSYLGVYDNPSHEEWKWSDKPRTFHGIAFTHSNSAGKLGYTLSLRKVRDDSYIENHFNTRLMGYTKLNYDFDENNSLAVVANYLYMNRGNFLYWKDSRNILRPKDSDRDLTVESNRIFLFAIYDLKVNDKIKLTNKSSYYRSKFTGKGIEITQSTSYLLRNETIGNFTFGDDISLISGIEVSYAEVNSTLFKAPSFLGAAAYGQLEYSGIKNTNITFGLRYDYIKLDSLLGASAITPRVGINYKLTDEIILRGSFGTGFRAPTPAEVFTSQPVGSGVNIIENTDLEAESSFSFELGGLYKPSPGLNFDFAFFQNKYDNFIEPTLLSTGDIQFINIVKAKIQGIETTVNYDLDFIPVDMKVGYTYLWARNVDKNEPMKYRARNTVYAGINYSPYPFDFGINFRYWSRIEAIDDALIEPPVALVADGDLRVPVYVADFTAGYNFNFLDSPMKIFLNLKNAFNYTYVEFIGNTAPLRNISLSAEAYF